MSLDVEKIERSASGSRAFGWLVNNPFLLLALSSLFWSGNHILGRAIGGQVPPLGISTVRWLIPAFLLWPIAHKYVKADWPTIRAHWKLLLWLCLTGGALFSALQYIGLQYTTALNVSVLNSLVPVLIVVAGALLFRDSVGPVQMAGIAASSLGVIVIIARGQIETLRHLAFNWGDLIILLNMSALAVYAVYLRKRPAIHPLTFLFLLAVISAASTAPFAIWEMQVGITFKPTWLTGLSILYVGIFPSLVSFACWNRGVELIGANRSGPYMHLIPVYTAVLGMVLLGETLEIFHVFGFLLILAGVWLASAPKPPAAQVTRTPPSPTSP